MILDKDLEQYLATYKASNFPTYASLTPKQLRLKFNQAFLEKPAPPAIDLYKVETIKIDGGNDELTLRIYHPNNRPSQPALMYFHGGGFVIRDNMDIYDYTCRLICSHTDCIVIAIDFRLAPEHPFPAAPTDCYCATQWVFKHADSLQINRSAIGVWGESCGGNLAAVIAQMARDQQTLPLCYQVIISPMLDTDFSRQSYRDFGKDYLLTKESMQWFWSQYLKEETDKQNPYAIPKLAKSLDNLPPALIVTTELDVLKDEGEEYANLLKNAGVNVTYHCYEKLIHGFFDLYNKVARAKKAWIQFSFHFLLNHQ